MTEGVRRKNYCAVLLDEIEKAHPEVFNILLQIFDSGTLTDARGRRVDFRNSILVMTSNLGSDLIKRETTMGFSVKSDDAQTEESSYQRMKDKVMDEVKRFFRPEFLNRIDATVVFHQLTRVEILEIVGPDDGPGTQGTGRQSRSSWNLPTRLETIWAKPASIR